MTRRGRPRAAPRPWRATPGSQVWGLDTVVPTLLRPVRVRRARPQAAMERGTSGWGQALEGLQGDWCPFRAERLSPPPPPPHSIVGVSADAAVAGACGRRGAKSARAPSGRVLPPKPTAHVDRSAAYGRPAPFPTPLSSGKGWGTGRRAATGPPSQDITPPRGRPAGAAPTRPPPLPAAAHHARAVTGADDELSRCPLFVLLAPAALVGAGLLSLSRLTSRRPPSRGAPETRPVAGGGVLVCPATVPCRTGGGWAVGGGSERGVAAACVWDCALCGGVAKDGCLPVWGRRRRQQRAARQGTDGLSFHRPPTPRVPFASCCLTGTADVLPFGCSAGRPAPCPTRAHAPLAVCHALVDAPTAGRRCGPPRHMTSPTPPPSRSVARRHPWGSSAQRE